MEGKPAVIASSISVKGMSFTSTMSVATPSGERYVTQLCKHFAHKVEARSSAGVGDVDFGFGTCRMTAEGGVLHFVATAGDPNGCRRVQAVIDTHLVRFAFREALELAWQDEDAAPADAAR